MQQATDSSTSPDVLLRVVDSDSRVAVEERTPVVVNRAAATMMPDEAEIARTPNVAVQMDDEHSSRSDDRQSFELAID